ncbi:hypothetical protein WG66_012621 [Moniliophthora roreri]|nr:hypothetical protein WG66_012621 [Moniliophthora roreri]
MISALAARRAKHPSSPSHSSPSPSPSPIPAATSKSKSTASKRKRDSEERNKQKRKRKKQERERCFDQEAGVDEEGNDEHIIFVEEEENIERDTPDTEAEERAYSPSAPIRRHQFANDEPQKLNTTYYPIPNQNFFSVLSDSGENNSRSVLISLKIDDTLVLLGSYILRVVRGAISLCGITLHPSSGMQRVFALQSAPIPVIVAVKSELCGGEFPVPEDLRNLVGDGDNTSTLIVISELRTGIEGLGRVCRIFESAFRPIPHAVLGGLRGVYLVTAETPRKGLHPFILPMSWNLALPSFSMSDKESAGNKPGVYLVKGPKKSGKSTFARTLTNSLLQRFPYVAYLETDLGQSEFTPPGIVSLTVLSKPVFGPPWTHPTLSHPGYAHFVGSLTPKSSPGQYLSAIQSLIETYRLDLQLSVGDGNTGGVPLVVNTMGWTKGLGADLVKRIEELAEPTCIFEFEGQANVGGWNIQTQAIPPTSLTTSKVHNLEPILDITTSYTPADNRTIALLSYFFTSFSSSPTPRAQTPVAERWDTTLPLLARYPYEVDIKTAFDKVILTGAGSEDVVPDELSEVLNGSIVALVSTPASEDGLYKQGQPHPSPQTSHSLGLAFVRGIDSSRGKVHILTPVPSGLLDGAKVLVKGEMEMPLWGWLDHRLFDGEEAEKGKPFLQWGKGSGIGSERRRLWSENRETVRRRVALGHVALTHLSASTMYWPTLLLFAVVSTAQAAVFTLHSPRFTVTSDGNQLRSEPLSLAQKASIPVNLTQNDILKISFTVLDKESGEGIQPQQTFLRFFDPKSGEEGIQPLRVAPSGKVKFELNVAKPPASLPPTPNPNHPLQTTLLLGAPSYSPISIELFDLYVPQSHPTLVHPDAASFHVQPEIHHTFRPEPKAPPRAVSAAFTGAVVVAPWLILIGLWSQISFQPTARLFSPHIFPFIVTLGAFEVLMYKYWVELKLGQVLGYGAALGIVTVFTGRHALLNIAGKRK